MINADEIAGIIKQRIATFKTGAEESEVGTVIEVGDNIARIYGLGRRASVGTRAVPQRRRRRRPQPRRGQRRRRDHGPRHRHQRGRSGSPHRPHRLGAGRRSAARPRRQPARRAGRRQGRRSKPRSSARSRTARRASSQRQGVKQPLQTGIRAIDALIPIGKGQRELIIGDRGTGKTAIAIDTIINQKGKNVFCIYVAIGQKNSTVAALAQTLEQNGAMEYTTIVTVSPAEPAALKWIAPFAGCAMGEELMYAGKDVLIIYDNLTQHAQAYREVSLLAAPPAGPRSLSGRHLLPAFAPARNARRNSPTNSAAVR